MRKRAQAVGQRIAPSLCAALGTSDPSSESVIGRPVSLLVMAAENCKQKNSIVLILMYRVILKNANDLLELFY